MFYWMQFIGSSHKERNNIMCNFLDTQSQSVETKLTSNASGQSYEENDYMKRILRFKTAQLI